MISMEGRGRDRVPHLAAALSLMLAWGLTLTSTACQSRKTPAAAAARESLRARSPKSRSGPELHGRRLVAYFGAWDVYARHFMISDVPADRLTHLIYAFGKISSAGTAALGDPNADIGTADPGVIADGSAGVDLHGSFQQILALKHKYPALKTLIAIGGWTGSAPFSGMAATAEGRSRFARSCIDLFLRRWPGVFDGIDIDWEYPVSGGASDVPHRPTDAHNFTLLLQEIRRQLDTEGLVDRRHYLLTVAAPAGPQVYRRLELAEIAKSVDWVNLMTYDFHTISDPLTNFEAPLYLAPGDPSADAVRLNVDAAVKAYRAAGVPASKIVVGMPLFGRGYAGVPDKNHGLYQPHSAVPPAGTWEPGIFDTRDLRAHYSAVWTRYWQPQAKTAWLYNPAKQIWISYEDPESAKAKAEYVRSNQLGGMMLWEISADDGTLLNAVCDTLKR